MEISQILSEENANIDFELLVNDDTRSILIGYNSLDKNHKELLKKYLQFLVNDMK